MHKVTAILIAMMLTAFLVGISSMSVKAQEATPPGEEVAEEIVDITVETAESTATGIQEFLNRLTRAPQSDIARVLLVFGGIVLLIGGWRIYDFIVIIAGFLIGASIAASLITTDSTLLVIAALLIGGIVGAVLSAVLYYIAVFLMGAYIGIMLTNAVAVALSLTPVSALALLVGGIIGGIVLLTLSFEFLVIVSSLVGAIMLSLGLDLEVAWTILFAVVGIIAQLGLMRTFQYNFRRQRRRFTLYRPLRI